MADLSRSTRLTRVAQVRAELLTANTSETQNRRNDCLRAAVDWLWEADQDLNYVHISDGLVRILERSVDPFIGLHVAALAQLDSACHRLLALLEGRKSFRELHLKLQNGTQRDVLSVALSGVPVFDPESGDFQGYRGTGRAITQMEQAPTRDVLSQAIQDASQLAHLWHWASDADCRLNFLCDNYGKVSGQERHKGLRREFASLWHLGPRQKAAVLHRKSFRDAPAAWRHPGQKEERRFLISGRPVFSDGGRFLGYRGVGRDVTELLRSQETALRAQAYAEQESRAKSDFLANMSHELRTSLNAIIGFSDAMRSGVLGAEGGERYQAYAKDIHESGRHLLDLVNTMLDLSRIEAGQESLARETIDIADLIDSCCRMMAPELEKRALKLRAAVGDEGRLLRVDPPKMRQILLNLLGNAVKFTPAGGEIAVAFRVAEDQAAVLEVRDSGVGIKESEIPKILTRFGRLDRPGEHDRGAGLGLAITKSLVELHGGKLTVESEEGIGARFLVRLPGDCILDPDESSAPTLRLL